MTSPTADARDRMRTTMRDLLIGPLEDGEVLRGVRHGVDPGDFFLTGILWPRQAGMDGKEDESLTGGEATNGEESADEGTPLYSVFKPSSIGITCSVEPCETPVTICVCGARYISEDPEPEDPEPEDPEAESVPEGNDEDQAPKTIDWHRKPFEYRFEVEASESRGAWWQDEFTLADGSRKTDTQINVHVRRRMVDGVLTITASLVNRAERNEGQSPGAISLYQTEISVTARTEAGAGRIVQRKDASGVPDAEEASGNLLYRRWHEYAVGHGVAAHWDDPEGGRVEVVRTDWMPIQSVPAMSRKGHADLSPLLVSDISPFAAKRLADETLKDKNIAGLEELCRIYGGWIEDRRREIDSSWPEDQKNAAEENLKTCARAAERMQGGVEVLKVDPIAYRAFCLANEAMDAQSSGPHRGDDAFDLVWFPFQLAFILLAIESVNDGKNPDRSTMDLLWFPTGGGKTEAYLGLSAFTIFLRRLRQPECTQHVDVLMRYTLRLLTVQQFQRAAAMICAADQIRSREGDLGDEPISIGLFVGQSATPNKLVSGKVNAKDQLEEERDGTEPPCTPRLLLKCPLCGENLPAKCYEIEESVPTLEICCRATGCASGGDPLPVHTVDDDIYRIRPSLVIGTVDKFAQLPRKQEQGLLFGRPGGLPPELIIQDELHLISGPLGTMAGLYETCIDLLCVEGGIRPKIIGSTATIGRAKQQVRGLFDRDVLQFPPAGLDADDSFFAVRDPDAPDRIYTALSSSGRSPKFTLQAVTAACLSAAQSLRDQGASDEAVDPYWTLMLYFNSLRELGGAKVLMRDDVPRSVQFFAGRLSSSIRPVEAEPCEITSRIPSTRIPKVIEELEFPLHGNPLVNQPVDTALASNMISVGMDISRLGLMIVNGQPKSTSEYIQATSRVGRGLPGLIVTCLNAARPRDMSHFEHFKHYHQTLYRRVEVTSVTPWSSRARDRALHAVLIAAARHLIPGISGRFGAVDFDESHAMVAEIRDWIRRRADSCDLINSSAIDVEGEVDQIIDRWQSRAASHRSSGQRLEYWATLRPNDNRPTNDHLMRGSEEENTDPQVWPTPNSMREVEPSAYYIVWPEGR